MCVCVCVCVFVCVGRDFVRLRAIRPTLVGYIVENVRKTFFRKGWQMRFYRLLSCFNRRSIRNLGHADFGCLIYWLSCVEFWLPVTVYILVACIFEIYASFLSIFEYFSW